MSKWPDYKKFSKPQIDMMWLAEDVKMQGFREAIEVLEEMDRFDNKAVDYIKVLKQLYDAAVLSRPPQNE